MKLLSIGAEAMVSADEKAHEVIKLRQPKRYRIKALDDKIRLQRLRREAKVMETLHELNVQVPRLLSVSEKESTIRMQLIEGEKVKNVLDKDNYAKICHEIGKNMGIMHSSNIIHGDLTTSNMVWRSGKLFLVDFGLSLFSNKDEDKAVDLHLFKQALKSSHSRIAGKCFAAAIKAYKKSNSGWKEVVKRLEKVEGRGRNKGKS